MADPESPVESPPTGARTAVVAAGDEELRVLLRGLLRLHRCRVVGEVGRAPEAMPLLATFRPDLLLVDLTLDDGAAAALVGEARAALPGLWIVLITPAGRPPTAAVRAAASVLLARPFRILQFAEAIAPAPPDSVHRPPPG